MGRMCSKTTVGATLVAIALLTGCSNSAADQADAKSSSHTMPDGSVMEGPKSDMDHGSGHDSDTTKAGPSAVARMICSGDVVDDVTRILELSTPPGPSSSWSDPMFTCTYQLADGPLVLSVHDAADETAGKAYFDKLRSKIGDTTTLKGVVAFGLPAFETDDGNVVFLKDGRTLLVDATAMPDAFGPDDDMSQTDFAYAVAASVIACWTEHG